MIRLTDLPNYIRQFKKAGDQGGDDADLSQGLNKLVEDYERNLIIKALDQNNYNKFQTAKMLNMNRSTFMSKLKKYNIT